MLHRFSQLVAACTVVLVLAGSFVTSTGSGLAVPDWPTTYGWNMFTFPPSMWVGGIFYEHGHRLIASTVGFLTIVLAIWLWRADPRRWMKRLGVVALGAVVLQGVLGGLTVLFFLPAPISIAHAGLAELFFCTIVSIAVFTSPRWRHEANPVDDPSLRRFAAATVAVVFAQILIGATMRHTGAGLAIPDFPLMFGGIIPDHWDEGIAIHFAHRLGALFAASAILMTSFRVWTRHPRRHELTQVATLLVALLGVQITLGALTVLSGLAVMINSVHVVCGALVLATSLVLALRCWRVSFADSTARLKPDTTPEDVVRRVRLPPSLEASADRRSLGVGGQADPSTGARA
jgi:cytochrome c oxidase assembly protein subunit 15